MRFMQKSGLNFLYPLYPRRQVITPIDAPEQFRSEASAERREREAARRSAQDRPLIRALGLAHYWQRLLDEGKYPSLTEIAAGEGLDLGQASRIARLAQLAPDIVEACVTGPDTGLALEHLSRRGIAATWAEQRGELMRCHT